MKKCFLRRRLKAQNEMLSHLASLSQKLLTLDSIAEEKERLEQECGQLKALVQELESESLSASFSYMI